MNHVLKPGQTMEDVIRAVEASFETVSDIAPVAWWYENLNENGRIRDIRFSDQMRRMLGYSSAEDFPDTLEAFRSMVHPDDLDYVMEQVIAAGTGRTDRYDVRYRIRKADGRYMWCNATGQVVKSSEGKTVGMYGAFIDISPEVELKKRTEESNYALIEKFL